MKRLLPYFERIGEGTWRCVRPVTIAAHGRVIHVSAEDTFTIGQVRGRFDIAFELERASDFEAQVLVDLLRLSRVTLLYGAQGVGKTTLLRMGVLPLLRRRSEDRNIAQPEKPQVVAPFPDRRAGDTPRGRSAEIAVVFDRWADEPLAALHASIADVLPAKSVRAAKPENLSESLAAWGKEHGLRFFIILDGFEQYLRAPHHRAGIAEFEHELVRMINQPGLPAHFLLSLRGDAAPLLDRFRERIKGFGDAFLRLPDLPCAAVSPVAPRTVTARGGASLKPEHSQAGETERQFNALLSRWVRRPPAWIVLAPSVAALVFITIYGHHVSFTSPAAIEVGTATDIEPAVDRPGLRAQTEVSAAPRVIEVPVGLGNLEAPAGPSAIPARARPTKPAAPAVRRMQRPEEVKVAASVRNDWETKMLHEIEACRAESFLSRIACVEHVRWKRCAPDRWNSIPACGATTPVTLLE